MHRAVGQPTTTLCLLLLTGCVGTMDSLHYVVGEAPGNAQCEVRLTEAGTAESIRKETVQGKFRISFTASGPFPSRVDVAAYCDGIKVKELKAVAPRKMDTIDLGELRS